MLVVYDDEVLRDGIDIDPSTFARRLRSGERATTSQPSPAAFLETYRRAAEDGETVVAILVSSSLSGTFGSAEAAARQLAEIPIRLYDSRAAALLQGMLALKAAELAEAGQPADAIVTELERIRAQSGTFFTVDVFDNLLASGRVGRGKVMIAGLLDIKPILGIEVSGNVMPFGNVRGTHNVQPRMLDLIAQRIPRDARSLRFGIMHVDRPAIVEELTVALTRRFGEREIFDAPVTPVIATHLGPGAWGIAYQVED
jgi:DegV family protein with EDD domain